MAENFQHFGIDDERLIQQETRNEFYCRTNVIHPI